MLPDPTPPSQFPSRRLTVWAAATRLLLALLVFGWLLLALSWAVLHGWIVPRIDQFRPQLQALATQATGLRIEIGELRASSSGVFPSFELRQVRLLDAAGQPALQLPEVLVSLSPRSLMTLDLEQVVIRHAELDVRRTADGRLLLAGLPVSRSHTPQMPALADWLLVQQEWALLDGTVRWTDELHGVNLRFTEVDAVMRNPGQRHQWRVDATPPAEWGERFSVRGLFKQALLAPASQWEQWSGQLYGEFSRIDMTPLQPYAQQAGLRLDQGRGAVRAWVDVEQGQIRGATADVALEDVQARLAARLPPLVINRAVGRLSWRDAGAQGLDVQTQALRLETADGLQWPGGNLALSLGLDAQGRPDRGQLKADRLDLQALSALAQRLPLEPDWQAQLRSLALRGLVEQIELSWQGPLPSPPQLSARGRVSGLELAPGTGASTRPGWAGVDMDFRFDRKGGEDKGQASVRMQGGWMEFPGHFDEPRLPMEQASGELRYRRDARSTEFEVRQGVLVARDAQGQFQGSWTRLANGDPLGSLDLSGQLSRGDATRVWRYLPRSIAPSVRNYVRQALTQGQLSDVQFKVKGALASFPFDQSPGEFQVSARLRQASYAYVPTPTSPSAKAWPGLTQMDAELLFNKASMQIHKAQARVAGMPGLVLQRAEARIAHLMEQPVVEVSGEFKGPLAQALAVVNGSPLADMTGQALAEATATGTADIPLRLSLPLAELSRSKVQGAVVLAGNDVQISPEAPLLGRARGRVNFTESGFQLNGTQARLLGGEARLEGGMGPSRPGEPAIVLRGQGTVSSEALQQWPTLAELAPLLKQANGSTGYSATVGWRQGVLELGITSNLAGMALSLPEPLGKAAAAQASLRIDKTVVRESMAAGRRLQDRLSVHLGSGPGRSVSASYLRDVAGPQAQVLAGQLIVGPEREAEPSVREVRAQVQLASLDLDAWDQWLGQFGAEEAASAAATGLGYAPTSFNLRADRLKLRGHTLHQVVFGGQRQAAVWRGDLQAAEVNGQGEYRPPSGETPGRLFARLSRVSLGAGTASEVETLLDNQPGQLPALDLVVDELELRGKKLGRLEIEAVNRQVSAGRETSREWRLNKLNLSMPEATLSASGHWSVLPAANRQGGRRGTALNFRLDVADSGELLKRLGLDGAIRRGKGRLEGQIQWTGSPLALHYPTLTGQMVVDVESGQFLKAEPGVAKLLGVLNLQALPRRLSLDFRDVFSDGFAFDSIRGDVAIAQGVASTRNLRMKGVNAVVMMEGSADIARETQDLRVVVVPELNAGTASLLAYAVNPTVALSTFLAQWLLRQPLGEAATREFHVKGTWQDPQIQRVARQRTPRESRP